MLFRVTILSVAALAVAVGWFQMFRFGSTPGAQSAAPARWPVDIPAPWGRAADAADSGPPQLFVFVHPQCSCTHATLAQLDQILAASNAPVQVTLVVYRSGALNRATDRAEDRAKDQARHGATGQTPDGDADGQFGLSAFPPAGLLHRPVQVVADTNGVMARRFGAATSGEIVLYAADGLLLFQGGITPERSHVGDSIGGDELRTALTTGTPQGNRSSVFGCPILIPGHAG